MSAERPVVQPCLVQPRRLTPGIGRRTLRPGRGRVALLVLAVVAALGAALPAAALALPDGRGYEQVTPLDKNGIDTGAGIPSTNGNAANWEAIGGCCGATSSAVTLYQSRRTATGWTSNALTPKPPAGGLVGLFAEQAPLWWTGDLTQTIYTTPASYDAGDQRPPGPGASNFLDLYLQNANSGALTWLSQGPFPGSGSNPVTSTFDGASADGQHVGFSSPDRLVPEATGLADLNTPPQFLYERNVAAGTTDLINVAQTTLTSAVSGPVSTTMTAAAVGTTPTTLDSAAGPAVNDTLTADATGHTATTLTADATGQIFTTLTSGAGPAVNTTLDAPAAPGDTAIDVADTTGLAAGEQITIDAGGTPETATIQSVDSGTSLTLTAPLANAHAAGATVTHAADSSISVADSTGFVPGQQITVGGEAVTVATVPDGTTITLTAPLTVAHQPGEGVFYGGDTSIKVASTTGFAAGQTITIGGESASIASVPDATTINLNSGLGSNHASGDAVDYPGDTQIAVNDTSKLAPGETITVGTGGSQESATIAAVLDATDLSLTAPLANNHPSGDPVTYPGDTTIAVADSSAYSAGQTITIDGGAPAEETDTIASVPDGTHITLTAPVTNAHAAGAAVVHAAPDSTIAVASSNGFVAGETITVGSGGGAETATIDSLPDASHITLTAPLTNNHASGDSVSAGGNTTIPVADSGAFNPGSSVTIGSGADQESATIDSVPDSTHITLTTGLVNNHASGEQVVGLVSPDGAILGNGNFLAQSFLAANQFGSTTNAISDDGTKVFFESPPSFAGGSGSAEGVGSPHLYMRDTSANTTTPIDNPRSSGQAIYEGAAHNGSKVFFTSDEGLGGNANTDNEVYEFNTATKTVTPVSGGTDGTADGNAIGVAAISNDGSHVYFTANADNLDPNATGTANAPNLYVFNTNAPLASATTLIATLDEGDVSSCPLGCGAGARASGLAGEPDISRPAIPTPDGTVLVFDSIANLTGQNPSGPTTTLAADASPGDSTITVADASGLVVARPIVLPGAGGAENDAVQSVSGNTVTLSRPLQFSHSSGDQVVQLAAGELYRYSTASNSLTCISCTPAGVTATGPASFGAAGGGSYEPPGTGVNMSSDGSRIFFDSPDPLVAGDVNTGSFANGLFGGTTLSEDVYEWENGHVSLISDGRSATGAVLGGTTLTGNDVFFTTVATLVPQDTDGFDDIYDARVGGGFPAPAGTSGSGCQTGDSCHSGAGPTVFFPLPASSTLIAPPTITPKFSVNAISAKQRKAFAKNGKVTITVHTNAPGKITASAYGKLASGLVRMSSASHSLSGARGGTAKLTLTLNSAGRKALAKNHKLPVRIEVSFSQSGEIDVATMTLTSKKTQHRTKHKKRVQAKKQHSRLEAWVAR